MSEHANVALIRRGFAAFNEGDVVTLSQIIAKDAVHHMPGHNRFSGDHKGIDDILTMYGEMAKLTEGDFRAELEEVYANDHRGVAIYRGQGTRGSMRLDERNALCFEIIDGKAIDLDEVSLDGVTNDEFWA
jgi:ketosteroid isomerase-like protein